MEDNQSDAGFEGDIHDASNSYISIVITDIAMESSNEHTTVVSDTPYAVSSIMVALRKVRGDSLR